MTGPALWLLAGGGLTAAATGCLALALCGTGHSDQRPADTRRDAEHSGLIPAPSTTERQEDLTW